VVATCSRLHRFEDIRRYAIEKIDPPLTEEARAAVQKGIDDAVYGLMMVIDGVTGGISNTRHTVSIDFIVRLATRGKPRKDGALVVGHR
jgi:hypothetical protein